MKKVIAACITAPRPKNCFGYRNEDKWNRLQSKLEDFVQALINYFGVTAFINGAAQGGDLVFFKAVEAIKTRGFAVENEFYIPYEEHDSAWSETGMFSRQEYRELLKKCTKKCYLNRRITSKSTNQQIRNALLSRNRKMVDDSVYVIGVYNLEIELIKNDVPYKSGTLYTLRYAYKQGKKIILVHPDTLVTTRINF